MLLFVLLIFIIITTHLATILATKSSCINTLSTKPCCFFSNLPLLAVHLSFLSLIIIIIITLFFSSSFLPYFTCSPPRIPSLFFASHLISFSCYFLQVCMHFLGLALPPPYPNLLSIILPPHSSSCQQCSSMPLQCRSSQHSGLVF